LRQDSLLVTIELGRNAWAECKASINARCLLAALAYKARLSHAGAGWLACRLRL